jgi:hypothetical protein
LLIGRIAFADHSPNTGPYSTRGRRVGKGFARDLAARALSGAAQLAPGGAFREGGADLASQESKRK